MEYPGEPLHREFQALRAEPEIRDEAVPQDIPLDILYADEDLLVEYDVE